jgi:hypothetical protein
MNKLVLLGLTLLSGGASIALAGPGKYTIEVGKTYRWKALITPPVNSTEQASLTLAMNAASIPHTWGKTTAKGTRLDYTIPAWQDSGTYKSGEETSDLLGKTLTVLGAKEVPV